MKVVTLTTCLEMTQPDQSRLDLAPLPDLEITHAVPADAQIIMALYGELSKAHLWIERIGWGITAFETQIAQEQTMLWLARLHEVPVGFVETYHYQDNRIQIITIGVLPQYSGRGIGKHLLSHAINAAWQRRPSKIEVCTRCYDGSYALNNYLKNGFHIVKVLPQIISIPTNMEKYVNDVIADSKKRGTYPSYVKRVEAHMRDAWIGRVARKFFNRIKSHHTVAIIAHILYSAAISFIQRTADEFHEIYL